MEESALLLLVRSFLKKSVREGLPGGQVTIVNTFASNKARFKDNLQYTENICTHIDEKWETKVTRNVPLKQPLDLGGIESAVSALLKGISHRTYASIRQFHNLKVDVTERVNQLCDKIKSFTKLAVKLVFAKASLHLLITEMVANQLAFIGGCVKSDHFKDFYSSRSYLLLSREI